MIEKILISACLLGEKVRYDGDDKHYLHPHLETWRRENRLVGLCPEVSGGLPVPRPAAEIQGDGRVRDNKGRDVTQYFVKGAERALAVCVKHQIRFAVLTESSPSCGSSDIYDGLFSATKVPGAGVTTRLLRQNGIQVFNQHQIDDLAEQLEPLLNDNF